MANCQCLVGSLINHSCVPNTSWDWKDGVITFITKKDIPKDTEITITYGPYKEMCYYKRQLRLNHYFFACKCDICLIDACKGDNLRCRNCTGPVVIGSALNYEGHLNGKCLNCYQKYDQFESATKQLAKIKDTVKMLTATSLILTGEAIYRQTISQIGKMTDLSLPQSETMCQAVLDCAQIIARCDSLMDCRVAQRTEIALMFDQALPLIIPSHLIDGKSIVLLKFWFNCLVNYMNQMDYNKTDQIQTRIKMKQVWQASCQFHQRLAVVIQEFSKDKSDNNNNNKLVQQITQEQISWIDSMLDQCKVSFIRQTNF